MAGQSRESKCSLWNVGGRLKTLKLLPSQRVPSIAELSYWKTQALTLATRNDDLRYIVSHQQQELQKRKTNDIQTYRSYSKR